jgi:6-phosphogluconolactonase/glucosamine-6-phosphate isomerase/deaminase
MSMMTFIPRLTQERNTRLVKAEHPNSGQKAISGGPLPILQCHAVCLEAFEFQLTVVISRGQHRQAVG